MRKTFTLITITLFFFSCSSNSTSGSADSTKIDTTPALTRNPDSVAKKADTTSTTTKTDSVATEKWAYNEEVDKMTSRTTYFAEIAANDLLDFPAPYDGGSVAKLIIRRKGKSNNVMLLVSKGQFMSHVDGGTIQVRFDSAPASTFSTSEPSDASSNVIFIDNESKFIKKLKTANKVLVQAEFFEAGLHTMEFNVSGFKWDH